MYKVAVVEDELLESRAICRMLEESDLDLTVVGVASSGVEALDLIDKTNPDIILLDIKIPDKNGIEVLKTIKRKDPNKIVIIVTAYSEFDYAHQALKLHANDYLLKPIRPVQLINSIKGVTQNLKLDETPDLEEEINAIILNIINRQYSNAKESLREYVYKLYDLKDQNIEKIIKEITFLIGRLQVSTNDLGEFPDVDIESVLRANPTILKNPFELFLELKKVLDSIFDQIIAQGSDNYSINDILNYIDRYCNKDISLNQVGEYANMSSYYLSKIFKKETGQNFVNYLTDRKIEMAKDLLTKTDTPIINIALELSYHEPNYFSKVFKKATGMTPTEYRKEHKSE